MYSPDKYGSKTKCAMFLVSAPCFLGFLKTCVSKGFLCNHLKNAKLNFNCIPCLSYYLPVHSQQGKQQKNMSNLLKVNNKDTSMTSVTLLWCL